MTKILRKHGNTKALRPHDTLPDLRDVVPKCDDWGLQRAQAHHKFSSWLKMGQATVLPVARFPPVWCHAPLGPSATSHDSSVSSGYRATLPSHPGRLQPHVLQPRLPIASYHSSNHRSQTSLICR
jgi:hypothetical protein